MKTTAIFPVILSGGIGTRLWPLSRKGYPKQLLPLNGSNSLIQETASRFVGQPHMQKPLVICNEDHRFIIAEQMRALAIDSQIVIEPYAKGTAPAAAIAAYLLAEENPDALMLLCSSDHAIGDTEKFLSHVYEGAQAAQDGWLVTLGITPNHAETGYGYIKAGKALSGHASVQEVLEFVEKPALATAQAYVASGSYYWNAGIFLFSAKKFIAELEAHAPEMAKLCHKAVKNRSADLDFVRLAAEPFAKISADSIDYAIMEKTRHAAVVPVAAIGWNDIGSWDALWQVRPKTADNNVIAGEVISEATTNCYLHTHDKQMIATLGVDNLVVVATRDAILVADKSRAQETKKLVERLQKAQHPTAEHHTKVYRPWGSYESIDAGERYQVKRIVVKAGHQLSLQKHFHRAEHWTVVNGSAIVHKDGEEILLTENQSVYLPIGCVHFLKNPGKIPLTLIEVQVGAYVGEDDIVRLADPYGRK